MRPSIGTSKTGGFRDITYRLSAFLSGLPDTVLHVLIPVGTHWDV